MKVPENNYSNLSSFIKIEHDPIKDIWAVTNTNQNITFYVDEVDMYIINSGTTFYSTENRSGSTTIMAKNFYKDGKNVPLYSIILSKEINSYILNYNEKPVIHYINGDSNMLIRSNLCLVSKRESNNILKANSGESLGVTKTKNGNYKMRIKNPEGKEINKTYPTDEQAAVVYDCLSRIFYPNDNFNNFSLNRYTEDDYQKYSINSLEELKDSSSIGSHSTKENQLGFEGLYFKSPNVIGCKVTINKVTHELGSAKVGDRNGILKLLAAREDLIDANEGCKLDRIFGILKIKLVQNVELLENSGLKMKMEVMKK